MVKEKRRGGRSGNEGVSRRDTSEETSDSPTFLFLRARGPAPLQQTRRSRTSHGRRTQPVRPETARPFRAGGTEEKGRESRAGAAGRTVSMQERLGTHRGPLHAAAPHQPHGPSHQLPCRVERTSTPVSECGAKRSTRKAEPISSFAHHLVSPLSLIQILASGGHVALYDYDTAAGAWVSKREKERGEEREQMLCGGPVPTRSPAVLSSLSCPTSTPAPLLSHPHSNARTSKAPSSSSATRTAAARSSS